MSRSGAPRAIAVLCCILALSGCRQRRAGRSAPPGDTSFAGTQARGAMVMGVNQYTSTHVFEDLPDGGRIVLERDNAADTTGIAAIRAHMRDIAAAFQAGDFAAPFQVHAQTVPGTAVMAARRARLTYTVRDRPRGAEVRIRTTDATAIAAVHTFLAFQRAAHRAAGHETVGKQPP